MKSKRSWITAAALAGLALIVGGAVLAQPPHHGGAHGGWSMGGMAMGGLHRALRELDLSPEQKETIRGIFEQARPQFQSVHEAMRANAEKLMEANPDDANYSTIVNEVSQAAGDIATGLVQQMSQVRAQIHAVLTPEQKAKLPAIQAEMKARMQEHQEKMRQRMEERRERRSIPDTDAA